MNAVARCDWCGAVDHHLIDGECPCCRQAQHPLHANRKHEGIEIEELPFERITLRAPARERRAGR